MNQTSEVTRLHAARHRTVATVQGTVTGVRTRPATGLPALHVTVEDDSGRAVVIWSGRRSIGGVGLGRRIRLTGLVIVDNDRITLTNPSYVLLP